MSTSRGKSPREVKLIPRPVQRECVACRELPPLPGEFPEVGQVLQKTDSLGPMLGVQVGAAPGAIQLVIPNLGVAVLANPHSTLILSVQISGTSSCGTIFIPGVFFPSRSVSIQ